MHLRNTQVIQHLMPQQSNLVRTTNCHRGFFKDNVKVKDRQPIVFTTNEQITLVQKAKTWYVDGTFKLIKDPFKLLFNFTIRFYKGMNCHQAPLCYVLMSKRKIGVMLQYLNQF